MNKYIRAISTNYIFFFFNTIFFLIITPLAIRVMGDEFYGLWSILYAIALFSNIGTLGIGSIVNKYVAESREDVTDYSNKVLTAGFIIVMPMALFVSLLIILTRKLIADNIQTSPELQIEFYNALMWIALSLIPQFLAKIPQGYLLSQYQNKIVRGLDALSNMAPWIGAVYITLTGKNLVKVAELFFFVQLTVFVLYLIALQSASRFRAIGDGQIVRSMLNFSGFMFIETIAIALFQQFDRLLVGFILGPALAGVYAIGTSIGLRLTMVTGQITEVMIPYASKKDVNGLHQQLFIIFRKMSRNIGVLVVGIGGILIIWMNVILGFWISIEYAAKYSNVFRVLILAYGFLSVSRAGHQTLTGLGRVRFTSLLYIASTITMLIFLFLFSKAWSLFGAVSANLTMVLLLGFNFQIYKLFYKGKILKPFLVDVGFLLSIFVFLYLALLFWHSLLFQIVMTLSLVVCLSLIIITDNTLRFKIKNLSA